MKKRILSALMSLCIFLSSGVTAEIKVAAEEPQEQSATTQAEFRLLSTTPDRRGDGPTANVATDTGIEFVFSHQNVDISKAFSISPDVKGRFLTYENRSVFVPIDPLKPATTYTVKLDKRLTAPDGSVLGKAVTLKFTTSETVKPKVRPELSVYIQNDMDETFLSTDPVVVSMYVRGAKKGQEFSVEAFPLTESEYKEKLFDQYRWTYADSDDEDEYEDETQNLWPLIKDKKPAYAVKAPLSPGLLRTQPGYDNRYERSSTDSGIAFPKTFEKGYYIVQVSGVDEKTKQTIWDHKLVQVNDLACYTTSVDGGVMVWLNDATTGKTASNKSVELIDLKTRAVKSRAVSDQQGVANMRSITGKYALLHIPAGVSGGPGYWQFIYLQNPEDYDANHKYMSYIRMDRRLYKPTDKIHVWGVVRGRAGALPAGTGFTVALHNGHSETSLKSVTVYPAPDGTFSTEISIAIYAPTYYELVLRESGGNKANLDSESFYIENYTKPEYTYETFSDRDFYLPGQTPTVGVRASFFEGTPASGIAFSGSEIDGSVSTNASGEISVPLKKPSASSFYGSCYPQYLTYSFSSYDSGVYLQDEVYYFPSRLILQADFNGSVSKPSVNVKTNLLDTSRLTSADDIYDDFPNSFLGKKTDTKLNITIKKETSKPYKEHKEVYYDWINKKQQTYVWYEYKWETQTISSYSTTTKNGELNIANLPDEIFKKNNKYWSYYYMEITAADQNGYKIEETVYLDSYYTMDRNTESEPTQKYYFSRSFSRTGEDAVESGRYSSMWYGNWTAQLGETVTVRLEDRLNEKKDGQMLYYFVKDTLMDYHVTSNRGFSFTESSAYLPQVKILGAYFDGKHIYPVDAVYVEYDYESDKLDVKITTEPAETKPGGTVQLSVEVRDQSGKPVQTAFNIAVVDKALLAISRFGNDTHPMDSFFDWSGLANHKINVSYHQYKGVSVKSSGEEIAEDEEDDYEPDDWGGNSATGGGGGPDIYERTNFKDTAKFATGRTDASGKAVVTMVVPDNLTSWKATAVAVDLNSARAGIGDISLRVTQPAFVQVACAESYLASEDAGISLRMRGKMAESTPVKYQIELKNSTGAVIQRHDREGTVLARQSVNFGRLSAGSYKFNVTGITSAGADRIELPFTVSEDNDLIVPVSTRFSLGKENTKLDISPNSYPVVIGFADERYNLYMQAASDILYGTRNNAEGIISSYTAAEFMKKYSDDQHLDFSYLKSNIGDYIIGPNDSRGAVALYPYDSPDVRLTAFTAMLMGDKLSAKDKNEVTESLKYIASGGLYNDENMTAAYMGLAALGEPVADMIRKSVEEFEAYEREQAERAKRQKNSGDDEDDEDYVYQHEFTYKDWNYICAALAISGDMDGAKKIFEKRLLPYFNGNKKFPGNSLYSDMAVALVSASSVGSSYASKFAEYLIANYSPYYSADAELAWFIKCFKAGQEGSAQFQYRKNGVLYTEKLDKYGLKFISFTKADLENPMFRALSGEVTATATYSGTIRELCRQAPKEAQGLVRISKTTRDATAKDFKDGAEAFVSGAALKDYKTIVYTIRFKPGAPQGYYTISDRIPSPLQIYSTSNRFTAGGKERYQSVYYSAEKQNLEIMLDYDGVYYDSASTTDSAGKQVTVRTEVKGDAVLEVTVLCQTVYDGATWHQQKAVARHAGTGIAWLSAD